MMWAYVYGNDGRLLLVCPSRDLNILVPSRFARGWRVGYRRG